MTTGLEDQPTTAPPRPPHTQRAVPVVHIITRLELGGAQENTLFTVAHLDRRRFTPHLMTGCGGLLDEEARRLAGVPVAWVPSLIRQIRPWRDLSALLSLRRGLLSIREEAGPVMIVHTHSSKAGILGRYAARMAGATVVIHTYHGFGFHDGQPWWLRRFLIRLERFMAQLTDSVIVVSEANRRLGEAIGLFGASGGQRTDGRPPSVLIRSGIDLATLQEGGGRAEERSQARAKVRAALGLAPDAPVVLTVACLKPQKAPGDVVEVAARVCRDRPDARFLIAGDGELRPQLEAQIRAEGLEGRVILLGWRRDIPQLMRAADLFLLTSRWEGLPRAILEALAAGLPVVATAADGVTDIIQDGVNGYVAPVGDVEGLAGRVDELLRAPAVRQRMSAAASSLPDEFNIHTMVRQQEALYADLLRAKGVVVQ
ncbi:MAG: glycosyltransferase family 4 protein [Nitrospirae bacterium]|nr:glycosyltransferase family 4 protein [Nitrospirota bacterium]